MYNSYEANKIYDDNLNPAVHGLTFCHSSREDLREVIFIIFIIIISITNVRTRYFVINSTSSPRNGRSVSSHPRVKIMRTCFKLSVWEDKIRHDHGSALLNSRGGLRGRSGWSNQPDTHQTATSVAVPDCPLPCVSAR